MPCRGLLLLKQHDNNPIANILAEQYFCGTKEYLTLCGPQHNYCTLFVSYEMTFAYYERRPKASVIVFSIVILIFLALQH